MKEGLNYVMFYHFMEGEVMIHHRATEFTEKNFFNFII
jgi:hypothetical protein